MFNNGIDDYAYMLLKLPPVSVQIVEEHTREGKRSTTDRILQSKKCGLSQYHPQVHHRKVLHLPVCK